MPKKGFRQTIRHKQRIKENHARFWLGKKRPPFSKEWKRKMGVARKGEKNALWKGDNASYFAKHIYLNSNFGKANKCENRGKQILAFPCTKAIKTKQFSTKYNWAKKEAAEYTRDVKDYYQLCISCHRKYDKKI